MTALLQIRAHRLEVVELAVADEPERFVFVRARLMTAGEVDDREPAHADDRALADVDAFIVGTAMDDHARHATDDVRRLHPGSRRHRHAYNSAHLVVCPRLFLSPPAGSIVHRTD